MSPPTFGLGRDGPLNLVMLVATLRLHCNAISFSACSHEGKKASIKTRSKCYVRTTPMVEYYPHKTKTTPEDARSCRIPGWEGWVRFLLAFFQLGWDACLRHHLILVLGYCVVCAWQRATIFRFASHMSRSGTLWMTRRILNVSTHARIITNR